MTFEEWWEQTVEFFSEYWWAMILSLFIGIILYSVASTLNHVEEVGLKNILIAIWEGKG